MKEILIKFAANAVLLYGLALLCGGRIRFRGIGPVIAVAIFLAPINVLVPYVNDVLGIPDRAIYVFLSSVVCHGVVLNALSYSIPRFTVENLRVAIGFSAIMGAVSIFLTYYLPNQIANWL